MLKIEEYQLPASLLCGTITVPRGSRFLSLNFNQTGQVALSYLINPLELLEKRKIYCFYLHEILENQHLANLTFLGCLPLINSGDGSLTQGYFFETTTSEGI